MNKILIDHLKTWEGCRLKAYPDQGGVWTIGYGCTGYGIVKGVVWSQDRADRELEIRADKAEQDAIKYSPILKDQNDSRRAAIASFIYNVGLGSPKRMGYIDSTLRKSVNAGLWQQAAVEIKKWDHVNGIKNQGLDNRRAVEVHLLTVED